jgi:two-component system phosphate regulon sensor histidine kinase PhoR
VKVGRITSVALAFTMSVIVVAIVWAVEVLPPAQRLLGGTSSMGRALILGAIVLPAVWLLLFPIGLLFDRAMHGVRAFIDEASSSEQPGHFTGPKWITPITSAFISAVDHFQQRESRYRNEHRELEIKHHVAEVERRRVDAVLHALHDAVIVTDAFNEIVMANEAAAAILGFNRTEALHKPVGEIVRDEALSRMITDARESASVNERLHLEHEVAVGTDEQGNPLDRCTFDVTIACVENHKHEIGGVVTILRDLTRERAVSQMKSDFVSKASHELRTPLSSIRAYVEMLVDGEADNEDSRQEFYSIIQSEADRLGRLIDNMLNISRIEAGIIQTERTDVDLGDLLKQVAGTLEPQAGEKEISINIKLAPVNLNVEGDRDMLYQAVLNLASNAVKYTPEGGRITLSADSDNLTRSVVVNVSDTGLGIPPDALPRVFDKFYRIENYKRVAKGTGLGLNLCKHIIETVHRGQIGVESQLGMGSKFWFSVPMRYAGSQAAA